MLERRRIEGGSLLDLGTWPPYAELSGGPLTGDADAAAVEAVAGKDASRAPTLHFMNIVAAAIHELPA